MSDVESDSSEEESAPSHVLGSSLQRSRFVNGSLQIANGALQDLSSVSHGRVSTPLDFVSPDTTRADRSAQEDATSLPTAADPNNGQYSDDEDDEPCSDASSSSSSSSTSSDDDDDLPVQPNYVYDESTLPFSSPVFAPRNHEKISSKVSSVLATRSPHPK